MPISFSPGSIKQANTSLRTVTDIIDRIRALLGGAPPDFTFAREGSGWDELLVVRFSGTEAISAPYRYEIDLLYRGLDGIDLEGLAGSPASLRIATLTAPGYRIVHGIIVEAAELSSVPEGHLYRIVLAPLLAVAERRTQSRSFVNKTLREIIDDVLAPLLRRADGEHAQGNDEHPDAYVPALAKYCYRITDTSRLDNRDARPYCNQYNESDLNFLSRLLEEEGISYHFEHGPGTCLLVLSDGDEGKTRLDPFASLGPGKHGRDVSVIKLGVRLREKSVRLDDYDWLRPALDMHAEAGGRHELFEYRFPGYFQNRPAFGAPLVKARLDRFAVEASYATGSGGARVLSAGALFHLDHDGTRHDGEYLVTKLELRGEQAGVLSPGSEHKPEPFSARFELTRRGQGSCVAPSRFRPACGTPKPRIIGSQTAFVTDEPGARGADIHVGAEIGCVRLCFHWDKDAGRHAKEPTSCWVRVSHLFAGAGQGSLFHPRVGDEVIVEFLDGDPDRPIVTGRVYNGQNRPPGEGSGSPAVSTIRSLATPNGGVKNEISFDDTEGRESFSLHAGRDMSTHTGNDRRETVTNNASSVVGVDRSESTGANRSTDVGGKNSETVAGDESVGVGGNQSTTVGANQSISVGADRSVSVAANETKTVGAAQGIAVAASQAIRVGADRSLDVGGSMSDTVAGSASFVVAGSRVLAIGGNQDASVGGNSASAIGGNAVHSIGGALGLTVGASAEAGVGSDVVLSAGASIALSAGASMALVAQGEAGMQAPTLAIVGLSEIVLCVGASSIRITAGSIEIASPCIKISGGSTNVSGGILNLN